MGATNIRGTQILDHTIQRVDLDVTTPSLAVVAKIVQGTSITISSSGADSGTGDVTVGVTPNVFEPALGNPSANGQILSSTTTGTRSWITPGAPAGQPLTEGDDTNVTLALSGSPATALLAAAKIQAGWTGTLAPVRGGLGTGTAPTTGQQVYGTAGGAYAPASTNILQAAPANPAGTANTAGVMCGLKQAFTPKYSGVALVIINASGGTNVASQFGVINIRYGTGTAPNNGAAATGTVAGNSASSGSIANANAASAMTCTALITGLTINTAYWFDLVQASTSATALFTVTGIGVTIVEL
jgi:hypothetical protein